MDQSPPTLIASLRLAAALTTTPNCRRESAPGDSGAGKARFLLLPHGHRPATGRCPRALAGTASFVPPHP